LCVFFFVFFFNSAIFDLGDWVLFVSSESLSLLAVQVSFFFLELYHKLRLRLVQQY